MIALQPTRFDSSQRIPRECDTSLPVEILLKLRHLPDKLTNLIQAVFLDLSGIGKRDSLSIVDSVSRNYSDSALFPENLHPCRVRFWELSELARFDHRIFPKQASHWKTILYFARMHLLRQASLFMVRDSSPDGSKSGPQCGKILGSSSSQFGPKCGKISSKPGRIVGTAILGRLPDTRTGFVCHVGVEPALRRQGLAKQMMTTLIFPEAKRQGMNRLVLTVSTADAHVQDFYHRLGFELFTGQSFDIAVPNGDQPMFLVL